MSQQQGTDFTKLFDLYGFIPSNAKDVPKCAICKANDAPNVCMGKLPDGSEAGFIPVCKACFDQKRAITVAVIPSVWAPGVKT
jgi:hypothetical protein